MSLIWPKALLALLLVPLLVYGYVLLMRRRAALQASLGTMGLPQDRSGKSLGRKRHIPPILFLIGVTLLLFGLARPQATIDLPHRRGTVILAFDVSNSMKAKDLAPNRMTAAKKAARAFVANQPSSIKIGVVAFANAGFVVQQPTNSKSDVLSAINRLSPNGGTSLAQGILTSIGAVNGKPIALNRDDLASGTPQPNVHFLGSAAVVLLSDGENTARLDPLQLAPVAAQAGVRIFTIGIGTANGGTVQVDGFTLATNLDESLLRQIAAKSDGKYFRASDAATLTKIYSSIDLQLTVNGKKTEVTAIVAGAGLLFFIGGAALAMRWYGRML